MIKQTKIKWENKIKHPIKADSLEVQPVVKARVNRTKKTETPRKANKARER